MKLESNTLVAWGLVATTVHHAGFVALNLLMFNQTGYAMASVIVGLGCLVAALALRAGWELNPGWFLAGSATASIVVLGRFLIAEWGVLDATTPLAALLAVGYVLWLVGAWQLWQCHTERRIGASLAAGSVAMAIALGGFAILTLLAGAAPISAALLVGVLGAMLMGWGAAKLSSHVVGEVPRRAATGS